jgi:hypothetical protein
VLLSCFIPWQQKGVPGIESRDGSLRKVDDVTVLVDRQQANPLAPENFTGTDRADG